MTRSTCSAASSPSPVVLCSRKIIWPDCLAAEDESVLADRLQYAAIARRRLMTRARWPSNARFSPRLLYTVAAMASPRSRPLDFQVKAADGQDLSPSTNFPLRRP